jgi:hypothetical protein
MSLLFNHLSHVFRIVLNIATLSCCSAALTTALTSPLQLVSKILLQLHKTPGKVSTRTSSHNGEDVKESFIEARRW